jgi:phage-related minor tail protein
MARLSITVSDALDDELTAKTGDDEPFDSKADVVRHLIERGRGADELEAELESERARAEDLRRQLTAQNSRSGDVEEVVEYVASEKELRSEQAAREQRRREASILTRTWWRLRGEPPLGER